MFQFTAAEREEVVANCDHLIYVVRAFVHLREQANSQTKLRARLDALEVRYDRQFKVVFDAIRELMRPPETAQRRRIGFVRDD